MKVVKIDVVGTKLLQRRLYRLLGMLRTAIDIVTDKAKLGRQKHLVTLSSSLEPKGTPAVISCHNRPSENRYAPFPEKFFAIEVNVRGVPVGASGLKNCVQDLHSTPFNRMPASELMQ